jgi:PAS domain S-box-containing protein
MADPVHEDIAVRFAESIDGRSTLESELIGTRQRLQYLLAVSPAIIYTTQASGDGYSCTFVSENLRAIMGYSPEEMTTDPKCWPERLHKDDAARVIAELAPLIEQGGGTVSYRFRHRDGHYIWVQDTFKAIRNKNGRPLELIGAWADITELKGARQRLQYLLAASPAIIYTTRVSGGYACTFISENLRAIMGYAPEEMTTDPKCWPERLHPEDAPRVFNELPPLIKQGEGTVAYRFRHRDGHYIWIQDTFRVVCDEAGQPIELVGAWADISERKQGEQAALKANVELQETKQYLTRLLESSSDAIISTDKAGNVVLFNEGAEILLGYRTEEVIGKRLSFLHGSEERVRDVVREMRKRGGTASAFDSTLRAKDGQDIPVLISASVLLDESGHEIGTVGFATDVRERRHAEDELQKAHYELEQRVEERTVELKAARERQRYLMSVAPGIMYTNQASGSFKCTFVSDNVDPVMGFSAWEMLEDPKFWPSRLHPEDTPQVLAEVTRLLAQGGGTVEYRFRHRDGNYLWIQDTFKVIPDETTGKPLEVVGSWANISDRKQAERALGERLAIMKDLQALVAASPSVIYTTQVSGDFACTFVSDNLKSTMGYAPWEMRDDPKFWVKHLHPDDAKRVFAELDQRIAQGGGSVEYRFRHRAGHFIWIQDTFTVTHDPAGRPKELIGSWADISDRKSAEVELERLAKEVELRNHFIRETFGRYLTDDVVATVLETPTGLQVGGEKRKVTMMMTDLRGFTSLSERLPPDRVVAILNRYLAAMVTIIKRYQGTIDEFIGDAIFVLFGAPTWREDDAQRAVACAVAMQLAMEEVNEENRKDELPEVEMGIGLHTGQVVLGNIGSPERMKYGVVGRHVNLTSRIQSYTTGGQILITDATRRDAGPGLKLGKQTAIKAKGIEHPVTVSEVLGIGGRYRLVLPEVKDAVVPLAEEVAFNCGVVEGSHLSSDTLRGHFTKLSLRQAEARLETPVADFTNLKMHVIGKKGHELPGALYAKVLETTSGEKSTVSIRFTSMGPEIEAYFRTLLPEHTAPHVFRTLASTPEQPRAKVAVSVASAADPLPAKKPVAPAPDIAAALSAAASKGPSATAAGDSVPPEKRRGWLRPLNRQ